MLNWTFQRTFKIAYARLWDLICDFNAYLHLVSIPQALFSLVSSCTKLAGNIPSLPARRPLSQPCPTSSTTSMRSPSWNSRSPSCAFSKLYNAVQNRLGCNTGAICTNHVAHEESRGCRVKSVKWFLCMHLHAVKYNCFKGTSKQYWKAKLQAVFSHPK